MTNWLRLLLAVVVAAHGIGHLLFLVSVLDVAEWGQSTRSWVLGAGGLAKGIGALLWLIAIVGFLAAAFGLFQEVTWWRTALIASALVSTAGLLLFWSTPVTSPAFSALVFNLLVVGSLLLFHWPPVGQASG